MKMFRPLICLSLTVLFLFTCVPMVSAANDSKKKDKKEESSSKKKGRKKDKAEKEDSGDDKKSDGKAGSDIDKKNPFYYDLKKLEKLQEDLDTTSSASKKKKLNQRIKKIQTDLKNKHDREVTRLKKRIHTLELRLKSENHKTFRESIEKQIPKETDFYCHNPCEKLDSNRGVSVCIRYVGQRKW